MCHNSLSAAFCLFRCFIQIGPAVLAMVLLVAPLKKKMGTKAKATFLKESLSTVSAVLQTPWTDYCPVCCSRQSVLNVTHLLLSATMQFNMADCRRRREMPIKWYLLHEVATLTQMHGSDLILSLSFFSSLSNIASNHNILLVIPI